ncbi:MAG: hypothetical protein JO252_21675, partial [Planctomycetaceae bacterium]|nr:hypothetical protein [Planctomycetaceae bacterium]
MDTPIQVDLGRIAQDLQIRRVQVESVVQLLDEGNTVPFITRYRKERTGNLNEVAIREIQLRVGRLRELAERKETILKTIEAQGKLTPDLAAVIRAADNAKRLDDLYLPFKPKKKTKASEARDKGLEPLALRVWNRDETLTDLRAAAPAFLNPEKGVETVEQVLEGVGHILAEAISEMAAIRDAVRRVVWKTGKIVTSKADIPEGQGQEYRDYFNYSEPIAHIPPHRVLAINRGDKEGPLKVKLEVSRPDLEAATFGQLPLEGHPHSEFFRNAALDALDRLLLPSMEREVRRDLTDMAERHAVDVFARNLRSLLLQPPIPKQVVLAIDPGFRTGCKVAVLDPNGNLLDHGVIHPHPPQNRRSEAKLYLKELVGKHKVSVVAIGNQSACRETEELVAEIIAEGTYFHQHPGATEYKPDDATAPPVAGAEAPAAGAEAHGPSETPAEMVPPIAGGSPEQASPETESESSEMPSDPNGDAASGEPHEHPVEAHEIVPAESHETPAEPVEARAESSEAPDRAEQLAEEVAPTSSPALEMPAPEPSPAPETGRGSPSLGEPSTAPAVTDQVPVESPGSPGSAEVVEVATAVTEANAPPPPPETITPGESTNDSTAAEMTAPPVEAAHDAAEAAATPPAPEPAPALEPAPAAHEVAEAAAAEAAGSEAAATTPAPEPAPAPAPASKGRSEPRPPRPKAVPTPPRPHPADALLAQLTYVIVNEAGASVYSASPIGREEFPDFDATLRGTISIGRRLQDPLSE